MTGDFVLSPRIGLRISRLKIANKISRNYLNTANIHFAEIFHHQSHRVRPSEEICWRIWCTIMGRKKNWRARRPESLNWNAAYSVKRACLQTRNWKFFQCSPHSCLPREDREPQRNGVPAFNSSLIDMPTPSSPRFQIALEGERKNFILATEDRCHTHKWGQWKPKKGRETEEKVSKNDKKNYKHPKIENSFLFLQLGSHKHFVNRLSPRISAFLLFGWNFYGNANVRWEA